MKTKLTGLLYVSISVFTACSDNRTIEIKNEKKGHLDATVELQETVVKKFVLDSVTAPKVQYSQIYTDSDGKRNFTFLNKINNSIYFYDYETLKFLKKLTFNQSLIKVFKPGAYHIKALDSIYVYNRGSIDLLLANQSGIFFKTISLIGDKNIKDTRWVFNHPQYNTQASNPFIVTSKELLFPGQYIRSVPDTLINKFKFITHINLKTNKVSHAHTYPGSLYGLNYNWDGQVFTEVFTDLHPDGDKIIFSFPVSHNLYISSLTSNSYKTVYGGSNEAGTISSMKSKRVTSSEIEAHFIKSDIYGAIKYDPYRKVYYRFLKKGISDATDYTQQKEKPVTVIIMDENFHYLGETTIGTVGDWFLSNTFVTKEGLNIEYIEKDLDETYLTLKIFSFKKIK